MAYGVQIRNAAGTVTFDSTTVAGGIMVDYQEVPLGTSTTTVFTYPQFAGSTCWILESNGNSGPTLDTALGYPRVTVPPTPSRGMHFGLMVVV